MMAVPSYGLPLHVRTIEWHDTIMNSAQICDLSYELCLSASSRVKAAPKYEQLALAILQSIEEAYSRSNEIDSIPANFVTSLARKLARTHDF
jgi:hypothetical protein